MREKKKKCKYLFQELDAAELQKVCEQRRNIAQLAAQFLFGFFLS